MKRRKFLQSLALGTASLTLAQFNSLLAATGFHEDGPYNGPLLTSYINTTCGACPGGCGIRVRKVDDIPVKIDGNPIHPVNRGGLCPVGVSSLAFLVHPDRIKQPLLRTGSRGSGEYRAVSWDEAENLIIKNLSDLKKDSRPEQLLFIDNREKGPGVGLARKFTLDFGSPNFYQTLKSNSTAAASIWGGDGTNFGYDLENARIIFCFGYPVFESGKNPVYFANLRSRLLSRPDDERGSFFIIDSRLSASAAKAERWIPINPNTNDLLAMGMIYLIIKEELYDAAFVNRYCTGFDDKTDKNGKKIEGFKSHVLKNYYPSYVSDKTGVPVDRIIRLARQFATTIGAIAISGSGAFQTINGTYQEWSIMALNAITGRLGKRGGITRLKPFPFKSLPSGKVHAKPIVAASTGKFPYLSGIGSIESLPESILLEAPYPIKVALINNVNLIYDSPQSNRFRQAFQNIPFSVVFSSIHNETTALADLILPDCTFFEKNDLVIPDSDFSRPVVSLMQPVVKPLYESRQSDDVLVSLGKKLLGGDWKKWNGYQSYLEDNMRDIYKTNTGTLFSEQFEVSLKSLLAERGWRRQEYTDFEDFLEQFKEVGGWWDQLIFSEIEQNQFPTTSGKFYFDSKPLRKKLGNSEEKLRELWKNTGLESGQCSGFMLGAYGNRNEEKEMYYPLKLYTFELTTSRGEGGRLGTMADMAGYYKDIKWHSWVEINPETAHALGLHDKQLVWVESDNGKQRLRLLFNPGLMPDIAAIPIGFGKKGANAFGENVNGLISNIREPLTGMPAVAETKVRLTTAKDS